MVGWHHQLNGHEFDQDIGNGERRRACCAVVHGVAESDTTEWLNNNKWIDSDKILGCCFIWGKVYLRGWSLSRDWLKGFSNRLSHIINRNVVNCFLWCCIFKYYCTEKVKMWYPTRKKKIGDRETRKWQGEEGGEFWYQKNMSLNPYPVVWSLWSYLTSLSQPHFPQSAKQDN